MKKSKIKKSTGRNTNITEAPQEKKDTSAGSSIIRYKGTEDSSPDNGFDKSRPQNKDAEKTDTVFGLRKLNIPIQFVIIMFAIVCAFIGYYISSPGVIEFHSDCTDTLMWAQAGYDAKSVFNKDFTYAALLPFSTGLIMQLFIGITGVSYTTHAIGMLAFFFLFSFAFIFMLREMGFEYYECAAAHFVLVFFLSSSKKLREIFWGHTIYYSLGLLFLFAGMALLFSIMRLADERNFRGEFKIKAAALGLLCALSALNGIQALTIFIFPMAGAVLGYALLNFDEKLFSKKSIRTFIIGFVILGCAAVGLAVGKYMAKDITAGYESAFSKFDGPDKWLEHINSTLEKWLTLAGVDIAGGDDMMSIKSMVNIVRIFLNLLLAVIPVYRIFTYEKIKHWQTKIFLLAHWVCTVLIFIAWIFGKISSANWRMTPVLCTSLVFFILFIKELAEDERYMRLGLLLALPLLISAISSMVGIMQLDVDFENSANGRKITLLQKNNCRYGYATFWNAQAVTVLTGEEICSRNVEIIDGVVKERYYQSEKEWYKDQPGVNEYFLLLSNSEFDDLSSKNIEFVNSAVNIDRNDEYVVLIFDHNLF